MTFEYNSTRLGCKKKLPSDVVAKLRQHLSDSGFGHNWNVGEIMDCLLKFRYTVHGKEERLMINHLEPVFIYLCSRYRLWDEDSINDNHDTEIIEPSSRPGGARSVGNPLVMRRTVLEREVSGHHVCRSE